MSNKPLILHKRFIGNHSNGFTFVEVLVYIAVLSIVLLLVSAFIFYFIKSTNQVKGNGEVLENGRRALEEMAYEIAGADGIYTPTTTANQLSLQTSRYLPAGEATTYIDFFLCGSRICLKKESQTPIYLTADTVQVSNLTFTQVTTNGSNSVRINLTLTAAVTQQTVSLTSTTSLRSY